MGEGKYAPDDWEVADQVYNINPYTNEGHFRQEWDVIAMNTKPTYKGTKDGQLDETKNWKWSEQGLSWLFVI